jgi:hypothetical protein
MLLHFGHEKERRRRPFEHSAMRVAAEAFVDRPRGLYVKRELHRKGRLRVEPVLLRQRRRSLYALRSALHGAQLGVDRRALELRGAADAMCLSRR